MAEPIVSASTTFPPNPLEILQNLIRFDTTNPPGNERECVGYIQALLEQAGLETTIRSRSPSRPNLIARHWTSSSPVAPRARGCSASRRRRVDPSSLRCQGYRWLRMGPRRIGHEGRNRHDDYRHAEPRGRWHLTSRGRDSSRGQRLRSRRRVWDQILGAKPR